MPVNIATAFQTSTGPIHTIGSVNQNATEILLPPRAKKITMGSVDAALYVSFNGTEGEALTSDGSAFTVANNYFSMELPHGENTIYVCRQSVGTTTVVIILE